MCRISSKTRPSALFAVAVLALVAACAGAQTREPPADLIDLSDQPAGASIEAYWKPAIRAVPAFSKYAKGQIVVPFTIDARGRVRDVGPSEGEPRMRTAAERAVRTWRYEASPSNPERRPVRTKVLFTSR